jgi:bacteriocin-like protein
VILITDPPRPWSDKHHAYAAVRPKNGVTIKESTMNTNTDTSGMSEICELTDDELDAVNGGKGGSGTMFFSNIFGGLLIGTLIGQAIG